MACPFVYSWEGEKYWFDAEPYGGAITKGLERDDYAELEHLKPDHTEHEPNAQALDGMFNHSDGAARFAANEYAAWKTRQN